MGGTKEGTTDRHPFRSISTEQKRHPAVVITGPSLDLESVVRTLVRADEHGCFVFVVVPKSSSPILRAVVEKFGAATVESSGVDDATPTAHVEQVARSLGFPGVLYLSSPDEHIDFSRCDEVLDETTEYGTDAPLLGREDSKTGETLAAIPAYNEAERIEAVVTEVQRWVDEVLVVDDGSTDDTAAIARRAGATVIEHGVNRGYGAALKTAIDRANRRNVVELVVIDGDGQHDPEDIPELLDALRETDANVVVGSRFVGDGKGSVPWYRRFGLLVINMLTNLSFGAVRDGSWVSDTQSGFRVYDRAVVRSLARDDRISDGMGASTDILYHAQRNGYDVEEVATTIQYDGDETSTQNPVLHGAGLVNNILRTAEQERPLAFFGLPGLAIAAVGLGTGYWSVLNYLQSSTFPSGLVLLCLFCTFVGCLLSFTAVILHSLNLQLEKLAGRTTRRGE